MALRKLGKSALLVSPIGLGTWQFSGGPAGSKYFWKNLTQDIMNGIVKSSFDKGINWYDTAEIYGSGRSERALSKALQTSNITENVLIATKWNPILRRARSITKTFPKRVSNLSPYTIDLHQIHNPYSFSSISKQLSEMHQLLKNDQIKAIGVSNFSISKMTKSYEILENMGSFLSSNQVKYSIFDRKIESKGLLDKAKELGITIIAYSPLEQGLATGIYHKNDQLVKNIPFIRRRRIKKKFKKSKKAIDELEQISILHDCTIAQIALSWITNAHDETVIAIPGASSVSQAVSNAESMKIKLSKDELTSIDELTQDFF